MSKNRIDPIHVIAQLIANKMQFSTRSYCNNENDTVLEIFAKEDSAVLKLQFPKVFEIGYDSRSNVIAKATFIL